MNQWKMERSKMMTTYFHATGVRIYKIKGRKSSFNVCGLNAIGKVGVHSFSTLEKAKSFVQELTEGN
jgi:hypothetical protein